MEHRWGERFRLELPLRLYSNLRTVAEARTRDVSLSGAFLEVRTRIPILCHLIVELEEAAGIDGEGWRIPAYVVRVDEGRLGVEWCTFAPPPIRAALCAASPRQPIGALPQRCQRM